MSSDQIRSVDPSSDVLDEWQEPPVLMVLSAPSGTGKSTICRKLVEATRSSGLFERHLEFSVSTTTRQPRETEVDGQDYNFVDKETFSEMDRNGEFLESARVHGEQYGTSRHNVRESITAGKDVLLEIDVQGAKQIKERCESAVLVFVAPPSLDELERRLSNRGTESEAEIKKRLKDAREELQSKELYKYVVINDEIDRAVNKIMSIRIAEKCRRARQNQQLVDELSTS